MAPAVLRRTPSGDQIAQLSRSISSVISSSLSKRAADVSESSLVSVFALLISRSDVISKRAASVLSETLHSSGNVGVVSAPLSFAKRQNQILAIPTTYAGLNSGPSPGAVVGIILGSVAGFILCLYVLLLSFRFAGRGSVVEEEIITTHRHSKSRSRSRHTVMTERTAPAPPPTMPAASPARQSSRRETIIIEERIRHASPSPHEPDEVIVEEEEETEPDIVEVIEEPTTASPSPPPQKPSRRESRRSGYRTVDPAEFGGGERPMRRVSKR